MQTTKKVFPHFLQTFAFSDNNVKASSMELRFKQVIFDKQLMVTYQRLVYMNESKLNSNSLKQFFQAVDINILKSFRKIREYNIYNMKKSFFKWFVKLI